MSYRHQSSPRKSKSNQNQNHHQLNQDQFAIPYDDIGLPSSISRQVDDDIYEYLDGVEDELEEYELVQYPSSRRHLKIKPQQSSSGLPIRSRKNIRRWSFIIILCGILLFTIYSIRSYIKSQQFDRFWVDEVSNHEYNYNDDIELINVQDSNKDLRMSERIISSKIDAPFQLGCKAPDSSQSRANAGFVVLARNSELNDVIKSIKSMERHFNQWYNYPWIFLNDEEFNDDFKTTVQQYTNAKVEFGKIPIEEWNFKSNVDKQEFNEYIHGQGDRGIMYGNLESYHKMCRFYSGFFYKHELVSKLDWYWRVEPDVEFYCDLTYDPFIEMEKRGKKYGFTVLIHELYYTIPGLFRETRSFINKHNIKVGSAWNLFIHDSKYTNGINQNDYDNINNKFEILKELEENINLEIFLKLKKKKEKHLKRFNPDLLKKLTRLSTKKPSLYEDRIDREEYNLCHFWSNFEIARTDLFTSPEYQNFFNHLEQSGGFYKERWGDAPIHSLAVGMMLDLKDIHYFRDIGYRHSTIKHCPSNSKINQLRYKSSESYPSYNEDQYWLTPDKPTDVGVGCRCRCPSNHRDIEDSSSTCMNKWKELTSDTFSPFEPIDLEYWEKEITKRVEIYLANGGDFGYSNIVETLYEQGKL